MRRKLFLAIAGYGQSGVRYSVTGEDGSVIIAASRNPEFDAARALLASGVTGGVEFWRRDGAFPAMVLDIEKAAKLTVTEGDTRGPRFAPWQPNELGGGNQMRPETSGGSFPVSASAQGRANGGRRGIEEGRHDRPSLSGQASGLRNRGDKAAHSGAHTTTQ